MSDDLARLTNAELARRMRENRETPFCREIIDDLLDEAATRLATPGDAVEVVAYQQRDVRGGDWCDWYESSESAFREHQRTADPRFQVRALYALSSIPERAHGEQMREAAVAVAWACKELLYEISHLSPMVEAGGFYRCRVQKVAVDGAREALRAFEALPPAEERT